mmetsp:Transcript_57975/g.188617  ORF Transcript_57975/g.188617 Transcript_57975/m.188617 type:complete len:335 (+) Transcript_57975:1136-2140(+)
MEIVPRHRKLQAPVVEPSAEICGPTKRLQDLQPIRHVFRQAEAVEIPLRPRLADIVQLVEAPGLLLVNGAKQRRRRMHQDAKCYFDNHSIPQSHTCTGGCSCGSSRHRRHDLEGDADTPPARGLACQAYAASADLLPTTRRLGWRAAPQQPRGFESRRQRHVAASPMVHHGRRGPLTRHAGLPSVDGRLGLHDGQHRGLDGGDGDRGGREESLFDREKVVGTSPRVQLPPTLALLPRRRRRRRRRTRRRPWPKSARACGHRGRLAPVDGADGGRSRAGGVGAVGVAHAGIRRLRKDVGIKHLLLGFEELNHLQVSPLVVVDRDDVRHFRVDCEI